MCVHACHFSPAPLPHVFCVLVVRVDGCDVHVLMLSLIPLGPGLRTYVTHARALTLRYLSFHFLSALVVRTDKLENHAHVFFYHDVM